MSKSEAPIAPTTSNIKSHLNHRPISSHIKIQPSDYRVLVIDDDNTICDLLDTILTTVGFDVSKAGDGMNAMSLLATDVYDLLITDLEMPLLDGYRLCTWLKKESPDTIAIIMTGKSPIDVAKFMATGLVDHWIFKPFGSHELYSAIDSLGLPVFPRQKY